MTLQNKIQKYINEFEILTRDNGTTTAILKNHSGKLYDAIMEAHRDDLPRDFIFGTFLSLLNRMSEYTINTVEDIENYRSEIVDSRVDIYTTDLTGWLAKDLRNVSYLDQAIEESETGSNIDGARLLSLAQYIAIDEVFGYVLSLFE